VLGQAGRRPPLYKIGPVLALAWEKLREMIGGRVVFKGCGAEVIGRVGTWLGLLVVLVLILVSPSRAPEQSQVFRPLLVYRRPRPINQASTRSWAWQSLQTIRLGIAVQVGVVALMTMPAIGFLVARLRRKGEAPIFMASPSDQRPILLTGETYALEIGFERETPESYRGARVDLVEPSTPAELEVVVEGAGIFAFGEGEPRFHLRAEQGQQITLEITPYEAGDLDLRIALHAQGQWITQLDLKLHALTLPRHLAAGVVGGVQVPVMVEAVEGSITWPPPVRDPIPRHLCLNLAYAPSASAGHTYVARAYNGHEWRMIHVALSEDDLAELNGALQQALGAVLRTFAQEIEVESSMLDSEDLRVGLDDLARLGNAAFKRIFPLAEDRHFVQQALAQAESANLEISSDQFFLPWELLYDTYDPGTVSFDNFWGLRHNISRVLTDVRQVQSPLIHQARPRIALFANPELENVREVEVPYFHRLQEEGQIQLWDWLKDRPPEPEMAAPERQRSAFVQYSREHESEVAHFACHAITHPDYGGWSHLDLSSCLQVRLDDLAVEDYVIGGMPVVVLNACGTGVRDPRKTSDFVRRFMLQSVRGVLATECDVPDLFASVFIQRVYDQVLQGETFGHALLAARRYFLDQCRNPLGLLYAAYTKLETRLVSDEEADKQRRIQ
jgi:hypothetical protein